MVQRISLTKSPTLSKLFLHNHTYTCVCVRACACACVCMCVYIYPSILFQQCTVAKAFSCGRRCIFLREALHFPTGGVEALGA
jgi:hypothetical protein